MRIWVNRNKIGSGLGRRNKLSTISVRSGKLTTDVTGAAPPVPPVPPVECPDGDPTNLTVTTVSDTTLYLTWTDNSTNEDGFSIERSPDGITFAEIDTVPANSVVYFDTTCLEDTQYWYRIRAYVGACYSDYTNTDDQWTYTVEAQKWWDAMTTAPTVADKFLWNTMIKNLITSGVWAKLKQLLIFCLHTDTGGETMINAVNPGTYDSALVNAPGWVQYEGYTGASLKYIDSNFNPSTSSLNKDSCSFGCYIRREGAASFSNSAFGSYKTTAPATTIRLIPWSSLTNSRLGVNDANVTTNALGKGLGLNTVSRYDANNRKYNRNDTVSVNQTIASVNLPTFNIYILCLNQAGSPTSYWEGQLAIYFAGDSLNDTDLANLFQGIETFLDAKGKGAV